MPLFSKPRVSVSHTLGERTKERALVTQQKRDIKKEERQNCTYYVQKSETKIDYLCCKQLMCSSVYKCSKTTTNNIVTIQFFRNKFLEFSSATKRAFIGNRIKSKNPVLGLSNRVLLREY